MNTWTKQIGYPLITVERIDLNNIKISQKRFLSDTSSQSSIPYKYLSTLNHHLVFT